MQAYDMLVRSQRRRVQKMAYWVQPRLNMSNALTLILMVPSESVAESMVIGTSGYCCMWLYSGLRCLQQ